MVNMISFNPYEKHSAHITRQCVEFDSEQFNSQCNRWDLNPEIPFGEQRRDQSFRLRTLDLLSHMLHSRQCAGFTLILNNQQLAYSEILSQVNENAANFQIPLTLSGPIARHSLTQLLSQGLASEEKTRSDSDGALRRKISYKLNPDNVVMSVTAAILSLDILSQNDIVLPFFADENYKSRYKFKNDATPLALRYELLTRLHETQESMTAYEIIDEITGEYEGRFCKPGQLIIDVDPAGPHRRVITPLKKLGLITKKDSEYMITEHGMVVLEELQALLDDPMSTIGARASKGSGLDVIRDHNGMVKKADINEMSDSYQRALYIALQRMVMNR